MRHGRYILAGQTPVPCDDLRAWGRWMAVDGHCRVRLTRIGGWSVSTVFLGLDHNFFPKGPPLLFETMAYREVPPYRDSSGFEHKFEFDDVQQRCATWLEAEAQHERVVQQLRRPGEEPVEIEPEPLPAPSESSAT